MEVPILVKKHPLINTTYKGYLKQLLILPLYHIFGFTATFLWFSFYNITFVLPESLASDKVKEASLLTHPTHILAVTLVWELITKKIQLAVKDSGKEEKFEKAINFSIKLQKRWGKSGENFVKKHLFKK